MCIRDRLYNTTDDDRPVFPLPVRDVLWYEAVSYTHLDVYKRQPLHQLRNKVGRFAGAVGVVHQIADAVDHDQSEVVDFIDSRLDLLQPIFGCITTQAQELQQRRMRIGGQSRIYTMCFVLSKSAYCGIISLAI